MNVLGSIVPKDMAITESKKQSDLEKRLRLLRQQVYGKSSDEPKSSPNEKVSTYQMNNNQLSSIPSNHTESFKSDITYLHQDLFKVLTLSSVAIGIQLILFFLLRNHILNLKF